ncbi:MAG: transposase [Dermatophilaceae bacterium]
MRDGVSTNLAEGYLSQLKRSIDGTHHRITAKHMQRYLLHFDFMYTTCKRSDDERVRR